MKVIEIATLAATVIVGVLVLRKLKTLQRKVRTIMATQQETHDRISSEVDSLKSRIDAAGKRSSDDIAGLRASIDDLKKQAADAGAPVDFSDVDAKLAAAQQDADAIDPAPANTGSGSTGGSSAPAGS